jgi:hypothetical protein
VDSQASILKAQIEASKARILSSRESQQDGYLLFSSPQEAMPKLAFMDPVLDPVDKIVWANIWIHAKEQGNQLAGFPSHRVLMARCNIGHRKAISRSLTLLRLTRWITLCEKVTDPATGTVRGNLYALHEEPAPLSLTQQLDAHYMEFLDQCLLHHDDRIRDIAARVSVLLDQEILAGIDPLAHDPVRQYETRAATMRSIQERERGKEPEDESNPFYYVSLDKKVSNNQVQNPHMVVLAEKGRKLPGVESAHGNLPGAKSTHGHSERSSSSYINKSTTTYTQGNSAREKLVRPAELSSNEYALALRRLKPYPLDVQQDLLDELGEQIRLRKDTHNPIRNPVGYLNWLCQEIDQGKQPLSSAHLERQKRRKREAALKEAEQRAAERALAEMEALAMKAKANREAQRHG